MTIEMLACAHEVECTQISYLGQVWNRGVESRGESWLRTTDCLAERTQVSPDGRMPKDNTELYSDSVCVTLEAFLRRLSASLRLPE